MRDDHNGKPGVAPWFTFMGRLTKEGYKFADEGGSILACTQKAVRRWVGSEIPGIVRAHILGVLRRSALSLNVFWGIWTMDICVAAVCGSILYRPVRNSRRTRGCRCSATGGRHPSEWVGHGYSPLTAVLQNAGGVLSKAGSGDKQVAYAGGMQGQRTNARQRFLLWCRFMTRTPLLCAYRTWTTCFARVMLFMWASPWRTVRDLRQQLTVSRPASVSIFVGGPTQRGYQVATMWTALSRIL